MKKALWWILLLIVLVVLAVIYRPGKDSGVDGTKNIDTSVNENNNA
ncbi:hypothetical protein KA013_01440 [Patescibacteria group bacterium]|nr:hypothetical protein [Patescibacteria group bacterium]